ncbi:hypothetical protein HDU85_002350 [Gaertneriomyces sp. JEL0708]|nr:hypothetical protein HDU85_002350 [Gaertneriomyces sp. JEL0708]
MATSTIAWAISLIPVHSILLIHGPKFVAPVYGEFLTSRWVNAYWTVALWGIGILFGSLLKSKLHPVIPAACVFLGSTFLPRMMRYMFPWSGVWGPNWGPLYALLPTYAVVATAGMYTGSLMKWTLVRSAMVVGCGAMMASLMQTGRSWGTNCGVYAAVADVWRVVLVAALWGSRSNSSTEAAAATKTNTSKRGRTAQKPKGTISQSSISFASVSKATVTVTLLFPMLLRFLHQPAFDGLSPSPTCDHPTRIPEPYQLLSRTQSLTGYISTIYDPTLHNGTLFMRCDHSLIGGAYKQFNYDSIFGTFYFLEFARHIQRPAATPDAGDTTLQIGLGVGATTRHLLLTSPTTLTLLEIDPIVYSTAVSHFGLPELKPPHTALLEDASIFLSSPPKNKTYTYIFHDVFTGGTLPTALFTQTHFQQLRNVLHPSGVLALNFVSTPTSKLVPTILLTLLQSFPYIHLYAEYPASSAAEPPELANYVLFAASFPIKFDLPRVSTPTSMYDLMIQRFPDHLVRTYNTSSIPELERVAKVAGAKDGCDARCLEGMMEELALRHWDVMREVLPNEVWEM